jgi:type VI secretion system protein ImpK
MTETIYWSCADLLVLSAELSAAQLPSPADLRQRILGVLERMVTQGRASGIQEADIAEARYAIVAFIDEQILKSNWAGRTEWMSQPLQLLLYREYTAGENFFVRMRALLHDGRRPAALEAYYLCLALGFRGQFGTSQDGGAVSGLMENAREQLKKRLPSPEKISPNAKARDRAEAERSSNAPFFAVLAGCALISTLVVVGLGLSIHSNAKNVVKSMPARAVAAVPAGSSGN